MYLIDTHTAAVWAKRCSGLRSCLTAESSLLACLMPHVCVELTGSSCVSVGLFQVISFLPQPQNSQY